MLQKVFKKSKVMRINENEEDNSSNASSNGSSPKLNSSNRSNSKRHRNNSSSSNDSLLAINGNNSNSNNNHSSHSNNNSNNQRLKPIASNYKVSIGDKVKISTLNNKLTNEKGTVMYIGYPYPGKGIRYGINLYSSKGDFDGTLMLNIKTGKVAKANHLKKYRKQIKKRKFFKAKKNHAIFVKLEEITGIDRASSASTRFTIEDKVEVRFRGIGKIKFVGNLEHTKEMGVWYGIQLKERRGRHDGTVNGVKYFECASQYGLHCRQNHLKLVEQDKQQNKSILSQSKDDEASSSSNYVALNSGNRAIPRKSITDKVQKSSKWASLVIIYKTYLLSRYHHIYILSLHTIYRNIGC